MAVLRSSVRGSPSRSARRAVRADIMASGERIDQSATERLEQWLRRGGLARATLVIASAELRMAERTLQHQLASEGTSFREVLTKTRLAVVRERLLEGGRRLIDIAAEVGFGSPQQLSRWFKAQTGESTSEFRDRHFYASA